MKVNANALKRDVLDEMKVNTNALKGDALDEIKVEADALEQRCISKLFDVLLFFQLL